jgi:hypothetical protein
MTTNGNRGESREQPESGGSERSEAPREPQREPQREARNESSQAPLDLPPPPPTKPFVVWSSSPTDAAPGTNRDE